MLFKISKGNIVNHEEFFDFLYTSKDGEYIVKEYKKTRSSEQNRYYRFLICMVEEETGIDKDTIHEKMKMKFLFVPGEGHILPYCRGTSDLNTAEFTDYIENMRNFFAEQLGLILPDANQFENYFK